MTCLLRFLRLFFLLESTCHQALTWYFDSFSNLVSICRYISNFCQSLFNIYLFWKAAPLHEFTVCSGDSLVSYIVLSRNSAYHYCAESMFLLQIMENSSNHLQCTIVSPPITYWGGGVETTKCIVVTPPMVYSKELLLIELFRIRNICIWILGSKSWLYGIRILPISWRLVAKTMF